MSTSVTIEITEAMLPHVRGYLVYRVSSAANDYYNALDCYVDPGAPHAPGPCAKTREHVAAGRDRLDQAEALLDQLGLDGDTDEPLDMPAVLTASPKVLEAMAEWMFEGGAGMIGTATLFGGVTREEADRWYLGEMNAGVAIRDALKELTALGVTA